MRKTIKQLEERIKALDEENSSQRGLIYKYRQEEEKSDEEKDFLNRRLKDFEERTRNSETNLDIIRKILYGESSPKAKVEVLRDLLNIRNKIGRVEPREFFR
jgi:septal ring factor EnvC (AmiA/AmiB activator)